MELFLSSCEKDEKSRFLEILANYMLFTERKIGKIIKIDKTTQEILKVANTPLLVSPKLKEPLSGNEIEIAKAISEEAGFLQLFFGNNKEDQEKYEKFVKHVVEELKYDHQALMKELNQSLLLETFIGGSINITICDILAFSVLSVHLNKLSNAEKIENCNVIRWADYIQNLKGINETAKNLKLLFSLPYEPFTLAIETGPVDKKQAKKDKKEKAKQEKANKPKEPQKEVHLMSKVDIRVGKVVNIVPNPEGDKLYNEEIDVGNGEIRKIASGLRGRVDINDLKDSLVCSTM